MGQQGSSLSGATKSALSLSVAHSPMTAPGTASL
jgi:hypothetical protein